MSHVFVTTAFMKPNVALNIRDYRGLFRFIVFCLALIKCTANASLGSSSSSFHPSHMTLNLSTVNHSHTCQTNKKNIHFLLLISYFNICIDIYYTSQIIMPGLLTVSQHNTFCLICILWVYDMNIVIKCVLLNWCSYIYSIWMSVLLGLV